jgi:cobalamin synthase
MKDSSTGAIGVTAIVFTILLKFVFLNFLLLNYPLFTVIYLLFFMPVFSKWVMIPGMFHGISARQDGLGKIFINDTGK